MRKRIHCFGELLLRLSAPGKELLLQSHQLQVHFGGAEANVAVSLQRLGHAATVVSTLPDNAIGRACAGELRKQDVDAAIRFVPGRMGMYFLTHGAMHRPAEVLYDRTDSAFARAEASTYDWPVILKGTNWLHVSGITPAVSPHAATAALAAMRFARANGAAVSFDCNFRAKLWGARANDAPKVLCELAREADLLFAEARDIAFMFAQDFATDGDARAAEFAFKTLPHLRWMAATARQRDTVDAQEYRGQLRTRSHLYSSKSYSLTSIVDRIGAGDAFAAGLIDRLLSNDEPGAIEFATAAGAIKHSIPGDFNLADRADIEATMSELRADVRR